MCTKPGSVNSRLHPVVLFAVFVILTLGLLAALPVGNARAAGHWTGGVLTNNSVDDRCPQLSSTHLVWIQKSATENTWEVKLMEISTGTTTTIDSVPVSSGRPSLSIAGDYVTVCVPDSRSLLLYRISTATTRRFLSSLGFGGPVYKAAQTDGSYIVMELDDGDLEIMVYDIAADESRKITNNGLDDRNVVLDRGRIVWQEDSLTAGESKIMLYDMDMPGWRTVASRGGLPLVSANWICYRETSFGGPLYLYRLSDRTVVTASPGYVDRVLLTDDCCFWVESPPGGTTSLRVLGLDDLLTSVIPITYGYFNIVAAENSRMVYVGRSSFEDDTCDILAVDVEADPPQPRMLAHNVSFARTYEGVFHVGWESFELTLSGDYVAAALSDGHDGEIAWAMWVEDTDDGDGGDDGGGDGDGGDGGDDGDGGDGGVTFSDVSGSPYESAIYDLASRGIILGFDDDTFRPLEKVSRQQFAKMIVKALGLTVTGTEACPFTDVAKQIGTDPFYPSRYVAVCASEGITTGKTSTTFAPYDDITHQQLITMVVRAADLGTPPAGYDPGFSSGQFSLDEHYQNARKAAYAGLLDGLQGIGSTYDFLAPSTRGECAQILYNLLHME